MGTMSSPRSGTNALLRRVRANNGLFEMAVFVLAVVVAFLVGYPLLRLLLRVFHVDGQLTLAPFREAMALPGIGETILNTVVVVGVGTVVAVIGASTFAWLNQRTNARMGFITEVLPLVPLLVPPIAATVGWVFLLSPRAGIFNVLMRDVAGVFGVTITDGPLNIFSLAGLIFLYTLILTPYAYLPISSALAKLDPSLEEASRICGVGPFRTFLKVTLPAIKPAVAAGGLIAIVIGLATFSIPTIIGTSADIDILSVRIYRLMTFSFPPETGAAVALSFVMLLIITSAWLAQRRVVRIAGYATVGGKGVRPGETDLGRWRPVARGAMVLFVLTASVIPFCGLLYISLQSFWSSSLSISALSLNNYHRVLFETAITQDAIRNSVSFGIIGGTIGMVVAAMLAIYIGRNFNKTFARVVDGLTKLPSALSNLILAVAFVTAFSTGLFNLYGTSLLLLLAYIVLYLPQSTLMAGSSYQQISTELSEASAMSGATRGMTFRRVLFPLMLPGLVSGFTILFVIIAGEVTASALLASSSTPVIGFVIIDLWSNGTFPLIAALGVIVSMVTATVVISALYFGRGQAVSSAMGR